MLFSLISLTTYAQDYSKADSANSKMHPKLDKTMVPKEVTGNFYTEFPNTSDVYWYDYPTFDYLNDWYDYSPFWYSANPGNYAVEFKTDDVPYKAVYTKEGKKIAIHRMTSDLPEAVSESIKKSEYKNWKIGKEKEEIFKDKDTDELKVYKVSVESGAKKHMLYYQKDGELLRDKMVS